MRCRMEERRVSAIGRAIDRLESAVARRAGFGVGTSRSVTVWTGGLCCCSEEGAWRIESDLQESLGGDASAPTPGVLLRAALGSCMAMSYQLRAAKHGVALTSIRVTVEADSELAGMLFCNAAAPPGYTAIRYHVDVDSPARREEVVALLDEGDRLSPLLDALSRANAVERSTSIRQVGA